MEELSLIRKLYRSYLSRYKWARWLKKIYLYIFFNYLHLRNVIIWQTHGCNSFVKRYVLRLFSPNSQFFIMRTFKEFYLTTRTKTKSLPDKLVSTNVYRGTSQLFIMRIFKENGLTVWTKTKAKTKALPNKLVSTSVFRGVPKIKFHQLIPARDFSVKTPVVCPEHYANHLYSGTWNTSFPAVEAMELANAQVMGKSDLIYFGQNCLHHALYDFDRDFLFEEMHGLVSINPSKRLLRVGDSEVKRTIPAGISLLGCATANYIHWLTETFPKLALLENLEGYKDFPLIMDADLHPNILESIRLLNTDKRELISLKRGEIMSVERLISISPVAYIPFDFRPGLELKKGDITPDYALYSPDGLRAVRHKLTELSQSTEGTSKKKLFLRRTGTSRQMSNAAEVEELLLELGFEIVEPETLTLQEQVCLFSKAELIVGAGGAALGNIVFAPEGCHVVVLSTWSPYTIHYYFSNLASILGLRCTLLLCEQANSEHDSHRAHMGQNVPIKSLMRAIQI